MPILNTSQRLKKDLTLFDVFAVSTGAMFSSGFFLLPGLAAAKAGPAVVLAYLLAGILILPAMFSQAELSTALPRAGGTYFFLDRSLGPMMGTIGGLGTYFALTLKTAFALIGVGAYTVFFVQIPIKTVAIILTLVFMALNITGAKETTALQRWLVILLLSVLFLFTLQGFIYLLLDQPMLETRARFDPFFEFGIESVISTTGFVFVSYAGLTKVASVAEEVKKPERNIPLGMILSLGVTSIFYIAGVFIMVAVLDRNDLRSDLTPVATAAQRLFDWLPKPFGLMLVVAAALAAFASTGNAGLLSASRYPLAMARDRILPQTFAKLGRFHTPYPAILCTGGLMILFILALDPEGIAKLASAFQLVIFLLVNFAVIVMRESRIPSYDPGYRSPLYPWTQIFGMITSFLLVVYMGWLAILFTAAILVICLIWYFQYARRYVKREGAIYHWFHWLGRRQFEGLDDEFRSIIKEKGLRAKDPFDAIVARSFVLDLTEEISFDAVVEQASKKLSQRLPNTAEEIEARFMQSVMAGGTTVTCGVALPHFRIDSIDRAELVLVRSKYSIPFFVKNPLTTEVETEEKVRTVFFLVSPEQDPGQHLRILAHLAGRVEEERFFGEWTTANDEQELREILLRDERFLIIQIISKSPARILDGKALKDLQLPYGSLIALIRRGDRVIIPRGNTVLEAGDRLTIIGEPDALQKLQQEYGFYLTRSPSHEGSFI